MFLNEMPINVECKIKSVGGSGNLRHRLLEMGIIPGTIIKITKRAPLNDPIQVRIRSYELSIRNSDAAIIEVESI